MRRYREIQGVTGRYGGDMARLLERVLDGLEDEAEPLEGASELEGAHDAESAQHLVRVRARARARARVRVRVRVRVRLVGL